MLFDAYKMMVMVDKRANQIAATVTDILAEVLGLDLNPTVNGLAPESSPANTKGWDSVLQLAFIASVEEYFGIRIPTRDLLSIRTLGDMIKHVQAW